MNPLRSNFTSQHAAVSFVFLILLCLFAFIPSMSDAANNNGWTAAFTSVIEADGPAEFPCGSGYIMAEYILKDIETNQPIDVPLALIRSINATTSATITSMTGTGPVIGPICLNPDTEGIVFAVDGGVDYYDFYSAQTFATPGLIPRGLHYQSTVWLRSVSTATYKEYNHESPVNTVTNTTPDYKVAVNYLPTPFNNSNSIAGEYLFVVGVDPITGLLTNTAVSKPLTVTGSVGTLTLPAQTLNEGYYVWGYYLMMNGSYRAGATTLDVLTEPSSGFSFFDWPFLYDKTGPQFTALTHTPSAPVSTSTITIRADITDTLSGVQDAFIYLNGTVVKECGFADAQTATCEFVAGPYPAESSFDYYVVASDGNGNVATSSTGTFTVQNSVLPIILSTDPGSCGTIALSWDTTAPSFFTLQELGEDGAVIGTLYHGQANYFTHAGLVPGSVHRYQVEAETPAAQYRSNVVTETAPNEGCDTGGGDLIVSITNVNPDETNVYSNRNVIAFEGLVKNFADVNVFDAGEASIQFDWNYDGATDATYNASNGSSLGAFASNEEKVVSYSLVNPPVGNHAFRFVADSSQTALELHEDNNVTSWVPFSVIAGSISADPTEVAINGTSVMHWNTENTNGLSCAVNGDPAVEMVGREGDAVSSPLTTDTLFTLVCFSPDSPAPILLDSVTVYVGATPELSIRPRVVSPGDSVTVSWNTHNNDEQACTLLSSPLAEDLITANIDDPS